MKSKTSILITGATEGIGAAASDLLESRGHQVIRVSRKSTDIALDLYEKDSELVLTEILGARGIQSLDGWVHCPADSYRARLLDTDLESVEAVLHHNFTRVVALSKVLLPLIERSGGGQVVQLSSIAAHRTAGDRSVYSASKAALETWVRYTAKEWIERGVRLNAVAPWYVHTPRTAERLKNPELMRDIKATTPIGRVALASEIATVVAFLLSTDSSYIVGQTLKVDGGFSL